MFKGKQEAESSKENNIVEIECFMCPLSYEVMLDPVITPYGHTYERSLIEKWLDSNESDPFTREPLKKENLIPNRALKNAIEVWKKLDKEWQENANRYKEMEQKREQQEKELFESRSKEKELVSQISELKIRDEQKGEELIAQKEQVNMFRQKYLMTVTRLHAIGRKKTEEIKYSEHEFLEFLNTYFPTEAMAIAALLDAQDSRLGKALEILDKLIFINQGEALAATLIGNNHVPSFDEIELSKQRLSKDEQVTAREDDFVPLMLLANRGYIKENLGKLNVNASFYQQAIEDYKKAYLLMIDEHWLSMLCNRWGWCLYRMQMFDKELATDVRIAILNDVVKFCDKSIEYDASYYKVLINKGRALIVLAQLTKEDHYNDVALSAFSAVIEHAPNEVYTDAAYIGLGGIYLYRRNYVKAMEAYEKAVEFKPIAFNYNELAKCYKKYVESLAKQDYSRELYLKKAIDNYEKSLKLYNEDEDIHCNLGYCLTQLGHGSWEQARQHYQKALEINPQHELSQKNLQWLEMQIARRRENSSNTNRWQRQEQGASSNFHSFHNNSQSSNRYRGSQRGRASPLEGRGAAWSSRGSHYGESSNHSGEVLDGGRRQGKTSTSRW